MAAPKLNNPLLPDYEFHNIARRKQKAVVDRARSPAVVIERIMGVGTVGLGDEVAQASYTKYQSQVLEEWQAQHIENSKQQRAKQLHHEHLIATEMKLPNATERLEKKESDAAKDREARRARERRRRQEALEEKERRALLVANLRAQEEEHRAEVCRDLDRRDLLNAIRYAKERAYAGVMPRSSTPSASPSPVALSRPSTAASTNRELAVQALREVRQDRQRSASALRDKLKRAQDAASKLHNANTESIKRQSTELRQERAEQRKQFREQLERQLEQHCMQIEQQQKALNDLAMARKEAEDAAFAARAKHISETRRRISSRGSISPSPE